MISAPGMPSRTAGTLSVLSLWFLLCGAGNSAPPIPQDQSSIPAKHDYALIFGTVWGSDARPVAGVPIRMRRATEKKFRWEMVSDRRGEFAQRVPPGAQDYIIQADIKVPKGQSKPEISVHVDENERKDVSLHLPGTAPASH